MTRSYTFTITTFVPGSKSRRSRNVSRAVTVKDLMYSDAKHMLKRIVVTDYGKHGLRNMKIGSVENEKGEIIET